MACPPSATCSSTHLMSMLSPIPCPLAPHAYLHTPTGMLSPIPCPQEPHAQLHTPMSMLSPMIWPLQLAPTCSSTYPCNYVQPEGMSPNPPQGGQSEPTSTSSEQDGMSPSSHMFIHTPDEHAHMHPNTSQYHALWHPHAYLHTPRGMPSLMPCPPGATYACSAMHPYKHAQPDDMAPCTHMAACCLGVGLRGRESAK